MTTYSLFGRQLSFADLCQNLINTSLAAFQFTKQYSLLQYLGSDASYQPPFQAKILMMSFIIALFLFLAGFFQFFSCSQSKIKQSYELVQAYFYNILSTYIQLLYAIVISPSFFLSSSQDINSVKTPHFQASSFNILFSPSFPSLKQQQAIQLYHICQTHESTPPQMLKQNKYQQATNRHSQEMLDQGVERRRRKFGKIEGQGQFNIAQINKKLEKVYSIMEIIEDRRLRAQANELKERELAQKSHGSKSRSSKKENKRKLVKIRSHNNILKVYNPFPFSLEQIL